MEKLEIKTKMILIQEGMEFHVSSSPLCIIAPSVPRSQQHDDFKWPRSVWM